MAIHWEESQIDCGRMEGGFRNVRTENGAPGTCSWIRDVLVGGNPAVMDLEEKPQGSRQYEERPRKDSHDERGDCSFPCTCKNSPRACAMNMSAADILVVSRS